jgi:hypothetical protein
MPIIVEDLFSVYNVENKKGWGEKHFTGEVEKPTSISLDIFCIFYRRIQFANVSQKEYCFQRKELAQI